MCGENKQLEKAELMIKKKLTRKTKSIVS